MVFDALTKIGSLATFLGRGTDRELVVLAVEALDKGIGGIRMRNMDDASENSLIDFVVDTIEYGSNAIDDA
jgi:hypothetical protein